MPCLRVSQPQSRSTVAATSETCTAAVRPTTHPERRMNLSRKRRLRPGRGPRASFAAWPRPPRARTGRPRTAREWKPARPASSRPPSPCPRATCSRPCVPTTSSTRGLPVQRGSEVERRSGPHAPPPRSRPRRLRLGGESEPATVRKARPDAKRSGRGRGEGPGRLRSPGPRLGAHRLELEPSHLSLRVTFGPRPHTRMPESILCQAVSASPKGHGYSIRDPNPFSKSRTRRRSGGDRL